MSKTFVPKSCKTITTGHTIPSGCGLVVATITFLKLDVPMTSWTKLPGYVAMCVRWGRRMGQSILRVAFMGMAYEDSDYRFRVLTQTYNFSTETHLGQSTKFCHSKIWHYAVIGYKCIGRSLVYIAYIRERFLHQFLISKPTKNSSSMHDLLYRFATCVTYMLGLLKFR